METFDISRLTRRKPTKDLPVICRFPGWSPHGSIPGKFLPTDGHIDLIRMGGYSLKICYGVAISKWLLHWNSNPKYCATSPSFRLCMSHTDLCSEYAHEIKDYYYGTVAVLPNPTDTYVQDLITSAENVCLNFLAILSRMEANGFTFNRCDSHFEGSVAAGINRVWRENYKPLHVRS